MMNASAPELCRDALPIIDIAPLLHNDEHSRNITSAALHDACVKYGFFYLDISAFVSESEPQDLVELARTFFFLPQDQKDAISLANEDYARGTSGLVYHGPPGYNLRRQDMHV
jgi:isopenicillin N synthase-like dioxygenase